MKTPSSVLLPATADVRSGEGQWVKPHYPFEVSTVIVTYNACALLERTIESILSATQWVTMEVIVVDNGSTDGSVEMIRNRFPEVQVVANERNLGLTIANNQGMEVANGRYLLLLDNDVIVLPGAAKILTKYLEAHPEVGVAAAKVLNVDGSVQGSFKSFPTPMAALFGRFSILTRLFPQNPFSHDYLVYRHQDFSKPFRVDSVSRCAMMVRRETIERAGPMDEQFFVYWSDVDWCRAICEAGYQVHCVPDAVIIHDEHQGGTTVRRKRRSKATFDFHRGAYIYYRKWHVPHPLHPIHAVAIIGLTLRALCVVAVEELRWAVMIRRRIA